MDALFSHSDRQYPNSNPPPKKPTRKPFRKTTTAPAKATVNDVYDYGPENPLIYTMTHRLDASVIADIYRICKEQGCDFDTVVTDALTSYIKRSNQ